MNHAQTLLCAKMPFPSIPGPLTALRPQELPAAPS